MGNAQINSIFMRFATMGLMTITALPLSASLPRSSEIAGQQSASLESGAEGVGGLVLIREWKPGRGMKQYLPLTDGLGSVCGLIVRGFAQYPFIKLLFVRR